MNKDKLKAGLLKAGLFQGFNKIQGERFVWNIPEINKSEVERISNENNFSLPTASVLYTRGLITKKDIGSFIFTSKEDNVFDSKLLKDAELAAKRLIDAINNKEKILIFGDYDVDGITSTSLLLLALLPLKANINFYLPNRIKDGYGLSERIVKKAAQNNYKLIITVDNGITAFDAANLAKELLVDLIITDHHRPNGPIPEAFAIIDSNQSDCLYPYKELAGVGTIFKIVSIIYSELQKELPDKIYELLMLGTVADVALLTGENRYWVKYGLNKINKKRSFAVSVLAQNSGLNKNKIDSRDIGFMLAPQLNALGRLDDPRSAVQFLIGSQSDKIEEIGLKLKQINEERKKIDRAIYLDVETAIFDKKINLEKENVIIAASKDWPAGVIGLVAGKLTQNYGKPAILLHLDSDGLLKGSCRSIPEFNIFNALQKCSDLLIQFGGHSFAAGLKLHKKNLPEFKSRLEKIILEEVDQKDLVPKIKIDGFLDLPDLKYSFLSELELLEPFGNGNEQPIFIIKNVTLQGDAQILKEKHVKCNVFADGVIKPVIFFNRPELYYYLNKNKEKYFNLAAYVSKNEWNDKISIELQGVDVSLPGDFL
ncbi:single-stranded-DNA-specific exonuclease RecJ [Candidatus Dependentiae bacterium]|nr:single-stranded-DNA-specific exonuclease RecJ [Candidatus Dependentiae bacterium]